MNRKIGVIAPCHLDDCHLYLQKEIIFFMLWKKLIRRMQ